MAPPLAPQCFECGHDVPTELYFCSQCKDVQCSDHFDEERRHRPGRFGGDAHLSHRKVEYNVYRWIEQVLDNEVGSDEQSRRHQDDQESTWFGLLRDNQYSRETRNRIFSQDIYYDLISSSNYSNRSGQYPSLVSFVGDTGAGKSLLIKAMMTLYDSQSSSESQAIRTPVAANKALLGQPTSANVHLYADPITIHTDNPFLFADCEGLNGGNDSPAAVVVQEEIARQSGRLGGFSLTRRFYEIRDRFLPESGIPAEPAPRLSRKFCTEELYPRVLYAFSDVICFVTEQANTTEVTIEKLIKWAHAVSETSTNQFVLPRVVIIRNGLRIHQEEWLDENFATRQMEEYAQRNEIVDEEMLKIVQYWSDKSSNQPATNLWSLLRLYFESIRVVYIPSKANTSVSPDVLYAQFQQLRARLQTECQAITVKKTEAWQRQNVHELARFFNGAVDHFSNPEKTNQPFDFFKFSTQSNPRPEGFDGHITNLMRRMSLATTTPSELDDRIASIVASCIAVDVLNSKTFRYPCDRVLSEYEAIPRKAYDIFRSKAPCAYKSPHGKQCVNHESGHSRGHQDVTGTILGTGEYQSVHSEETRTSFVDTIKTRYQEWDVKWKQGQEADYAKAVLRQHEKILGQQNSLYAAHMKSNKSCFYCLMNHPDFTLPCGHTICESCIRQFGRQDNRQRCLDLFTFDNCFICGLTSSWSMRLRPNGSGVRILTLDGGGIRGILSAKILQMLEQAIGVDIPLHEFLDMAVGTSTGSNLWSALESLEQFKMLAKGCFVRHAIAYIPLVSYFMTLATGSVYRCSDIEEQLQKAFQDTRDTAYVLGCSRTTDRSGRRDLKVAVTATTSPDQHAVVLSNYNRKILNTGPEFLRHDDPSSELMTWEMARCTSAAPMMFLQYRKNGTDYIDGGLMNNNPASLAINEAKMAWDKRLKPYHLDLLVSVGTGYCDEKPPKGSKGKAWEQFFPKFTVDAWNAFEKSLDGEHQWVTFFDSLKPREQNRCHRLNVAFPLKKLPAIDDTSRLDYLEQKAEDTFKGPEGPGGKSLQKVANTLIAASFFLKILQINRALHNGEYHVTGMIHCHLESRYQKKLIPVLQRKGCKFWINRSLYSIEDMMFSEGVVEIPVDYYVPELSSRKATPVYLSLDGGMYHISGSPWTYNEQDESINVDRFRRNSPAPPSSPSPAQ